MAIDLSKPEMPTEEELERAEAFSKGSAKKLIAQYLDSLAEYNQNASKIANELVKSAASARRLSHARIYCGSFLAIIALGLCAYGIEMNASIVQLAGFVAPVSGLAGIFLYQPRNKAQKTLPPRRKPPSLPPPD